MRTNSEYTFSPLPSNAEARPGVANPYGQRYVVDFDLIRNGRTIRIRSSWDPCELGKTCRG